MDQESSPAPKPRRVGPYGPRQLANLLGLREWQMERALADATIPTRDLPRGWSAEVVNDLLSRADAIRAHVGSIADYGSVGAAEELSKRLGTTVEADTVIELHRRGLIARVEDYKGWPVYCGRSLEQLAIDPGTLAEAAVAGELLTTDAAARYLRIRKADLAHLVRSGRLAPTRHGKSGWQRRREAPIVALYRRGDLDELTGAPDIDWDAVRRTPAGRPSPLASLGQIEPDPRSTRRA